MQAVMEEQVGREKVWIRLHETNVEILQWLEKRLEQMLNQTFLIVETISRIELSEQKGTRSRNYETTFQFQSLAVPNFPNILNRDLRPVIQNANIRAPRASGLMVFIPGIPYTCDSYRQFLTPVYPVFNGLDRSFESDRGVRLIWCQR
jgi:hypothetical protein